MRFQAAALAGAVLPGLSLASPWIQGRQFANSSSAAVSSTPNSVGVSSTPQAGGSTAASSVAGGSTSGGSTPTSAAVSSSTSAAASATASVDLSGASLTNAMLTTINGKQAVLLEPPANGEAAIAVAVTAPTTQPGDGLSASFTCQVGASAGSKKRQTGETDCRLVVTIGGVEVYDEPLYTDGGAAQSISTGSVAATDNTTLGIVEQCGDTPVSLGVYDVSLVAASASSSTSSNTFTGTQTQSIPTSAITLPSITNTESLTFSSVTPASSVPSGSATVTSTTSSASASVTPGFPVEIGNFDFYGCVGSSAGFPDFALTATSSYMTLELCTGFCSNYTFAGIYDNSCYCGSQIDGTDTAKVATTECDIPCPGNANENCGGLTSATRLARRQTVPAGVLLTVYVNVDILPVEIITSVTTLTTGGATVTSTVVTTSTVEVVTTATVAVATTTVGPDGVTSTDIVTVTTTYCPICAQPTPGLCVGDYCGFWWAFEEFAGSDCEGELVFVKEECGCESGYDYQPKVCSGSDCEGLTVYKPYQCSDMSCNGTTCWQPESCDTCTGGVSFSQASASASASASSSGSSAAAGAAAAAGAGSGSAAASASAAAEAGSSSSGSSSSGSSSSGSSSSSSGSGTGSTVVTAGSSRVAAGSALALGLAILAAF